MRHLWARVLPRVSRRSAVIWNGEPIPQSASVEQLAALLTEGPPACWVAFAALGERDDPETLALLVSETHSDDEHRRRAAVEAIGKHGAGATARGIVRDLLIDQSPVVVRSAIEAAANIQDQDSHGLIVQALRVGDPAIRQSALRALHRLWEPGDFDAVVRIAQTDRDRSTRREASHVLSDHPDRMRWRRLMDLWVESDLPRERVWACKLIGKFGGAADRTALKGMLADTDGHVRKAAQSAMSAIKPLRSDG
jgi:HEAT repeat protein